MSENKKYNDEMDNLYPNEYGENSFLESNREYRDMNSDRGGIPSWWDAIESDINNEKEEMKIKNKLSTTTKTKKKLKFIYVISTVSIFLLLAVYMIMDNPELVEKIKVSIFGK